MSRLPGHTFTPKYEESETAIRERMLANKRLESWRLEPGDFMHDAVAGANPLEVQRLQITQDEILRQSTALFAEGEAMDWKLEEVGLTRIKATKSKREIEIEAEAGVVIPAAHNVSTIILDGEGSPIQFPLDNRIEFTETGVLTVTITCEEEGTIGNIPEGSSFILSPSISGVRLITDKGIKIPARNRETDDEAFQRYLFKVRYPDTGGNRRDYVRWVLENEAVGRVIVIPAWQGNGTVKVVIIDNEYQPANELLVNEVQEFLDPGKTGLGEGKAPCGATVTVEAAQAVPITITANVDVTTGYSIADVQERVTKAVKAYLKEIAFKERTTDEPGIRVRLPVIYQRIGGILITTEGVSNYSDLLMNGATDDVTIQTEEVAILQGVELNG